MKFLQRTRDGESNSVEILRDLDHIETATTQMEQHLGEIIAYVEDVIVSCLHYRYGVFDKTFSLHQIGSIQAITEPTYF